MLKLILGVAGTGKTTHLLSILNEKAQNKKQSIFLVPEQFSSSAEMLVYNTLGDEKSSFVSVVSFRTLAQRILKEMGKENMPVLTDAGRVVFLRRALEALETETPIYARHKRSPAFCQTLSQTIAELKTAGATAKKLKDVAQKEDEPKFLELSLIMQAYEATINNVALDPEDRIVKAAQFADDYFANKTCVIDDFDGFTSPEYELIRKIIENCNNTIIALCCNSLQENEDGLGKFSPVKETAHHLMQMANLSGVQKVHHEILQGQKRAKTKGLAALNNFLINDSKQDNLPNDGVYLTKTDDEWAEAKLAAAQMNYLASKGVSLSNMAIVCRDVDLYKNAVRRAFRLFEIPFFEDSPQTIEYTAPIAFLRSAISLLRYGLSSGPILSLVKTGLCGYTESEISALENYVYIWQPFAAQWRQPFKNNPLGLLRSETEDGNLQLEMAEKLRSELVPVIEKFSKGISQKTANEVIESLYILMQQVNAPENADALEKEIAAKNPTLARRASRAWDVSMDLLSELEQLVQNEKLTPDELDELLVLLVRSNDFGMAPQTLECVVFTSADRMRLANIDYCFIVGITEGDFPRQVGYSGLLNHADRDMLVKHDVKMPGSFKNRVLLEEMFFYKAVTAARKGLYLSYPERRNGEKKQPSAILESINKALSPPKLSLSIAAQTATPRAAFDFLGTEYRNNTSEAAAIYEALSKQNNSWASALTILDKMENNGNFKLNNTASLHQLLGNEMSISATRAEQYFGCSFAYYMERILKVKGRRKAELSALESGTFVHYILEKVLIETKENFANTPNDILQSLAHKYSNQFVEENLLAQTKRQQFLLSRIENNVTNLLFHLRDSALQSEFVIDELELDIGQGEISPLVVQTKNGKQVKINGKIDRVDVLCKNEKTYLCIMDYKTGSKDFNLTDVYCGLNMQMMIYVHTLCKNGTEKYKNAVPAAVLYLTADPTTESKSRYDKSEQVQYELDGLILEDEAIIKALEKEGTGVFLPVAFGANGKVKKGKAKLASLQKFGKIGNHIESLLLQMATDVYEGEFDANPLVKADKRPCKFCDYRATCRHEDGINEKEVTAPKDVFSDEKKPDKTLASKN